jgi:hypothetical protein
MSSIWNEMLDQFRALGGTADNICLRDGAHGRGLFPVDPSKPVRVQIPESLLLHEKHIVVENNIFRVAPEAPTGARERRFLEQYERDFSWGIGYPDTLALLQMMHEAPAKLRDLLQRSFECHRWLAESTPVIVQYRFFSSRNITYKDNSVIMPIVELANHGHETQYQFNDGVGLEGLFSGEILVRYQQSDPLNIFNKWGFVSESESFALSLPLRLDSQSGALTIGRHILGLKSAAKPFFPEAATEGKTLKLPFLLLGHRTSQRWPKGIFNRLMRDAGRLRADAEETFDIVQHLNRMEWYKLIRECEGAPPPLARLLRQLASCQLELMSHYGGSSDV